MQNGTYINMEGFFKIPTGCFWVGTEPRGGISLGNGIIEGTEQ